MTRSIILKTKLAGLAMLALPAIVLAAEEGHAAVAEHGTAAAEHAATATPFAGTIAQSIAAVVVFFIVFFVLKAKAWGPILKGLADRESKIKKDLEDAHSLRAQAAAELAGYQKQIGDAQNQVREMFASAQKDAEALGTRLKMQAQQEIEADKKRAKDDIEASRKEALAQIHAEAANLGTAIASKILKRQINDADQHELVRASLEELALAGGR